MGDHTTTTAPDDQQIRAFTQRVLTDLHALESIIDNNMIERGQRRVGVEQEMFLVDERCRPLPVGYQLHDSLDRDLFTTELARFNFEANLPPWHLDAGFLVRLEKELRETIAAVEHAVQRYGGRVLLTGILPTLRLDDLGLANLTPEPRFQSMNWALSRLRNGRFAVRIEGIDDLDLIHDSVMIESANTSLQLHLQVEAGEFARLYNLAQLVSAPLLAAATNSPVLLGRRLWHETRVALFERAIDERTPAQVDRGLVSRVSFGDAWLQSSVLELFRDNAARFHVIMTRDSGSDPLLALEQGQTPELSALALHNGTVWRWNRPCYGVSDGVAHLRIENRVLPAGPTILDEVANAALYYGLMLGLENLSEEIPQRLPFSAAKSNFRMAAQNGLKAELLWLDGRHRAADRMLLDELIRTADAGLARAGVSSAERNRYLGIIEARVENGRTGSHWLLEALRETENAPQSTACIDGVTQQMLKQQKEGRPVHEWRAARVVTPVHEQPTQSLTVGDVMTREVFTVLPRDLLDLATNVMTWRHIRHVPVEDESGALVGVLTARRLLKAHGERALGAVKEAVSVASVMETELVRVAPGMRLAEAVELLLDARPGCLMVVSNDRLVGIVTDRDLLQATRGLLGAGETTSSLAQ
jgi:CBS domain-containing protein